MLSDIRLHLQNIQHQKSQLQAALDNDDCSDEELRLLEKEVKRLEEKLEKHREICRLQLELQQTSIKSHFDDDQSPRRE